MTIIIKKQNMKQSVLTIIRNDGTSTWAKLYKGMETHDIAHYCVESTLNFSHAFYGIINHDYKIQDFALPREERPHAVKPENLHNEALVTEHIVNLLEVEKQSDSRNNDFIKTLKMILEQNNLSFPNKLNETSLQKIRRDYHQLVDKWESLKEDEELRITFTP